jgi:hypothetical protein
VPITTLVSASPPTAPEPDNRAATNVATASAVAIPIPPSICVATSTISTRRWTAGATAAMK